MQNRWVGDGSACYTLSIGLGPGMGAEEFAAAGNFLGGFANPPQSQSLSHFGMLAKLGACPARPKAYEKLFYIAAFCRPDMLAELVAVHQRWAESEWWWCAVFEPEEDNTTTGIGAAPGHSWLYHRTANRTFDTFPRDGVGLNYRENFRLVPGRIYNEIPFGIPEAPGEDYDVLTEAGKVVTAVVLPDGWIESDILRELREL